MYALAIGASDESVFAIKEAQRMGYTVIGFDGNPEAVGLKFSNKPYVVDIRNAHDLYDIIDKQSATRENMVVLPTPIGRYLISSGIVNEHYGLKGVNFEIADICTDKYRFHKILSNEGLRNINCTLLEKGNKPDTPPLTSR